MCDLHGVVYAGRTEAMDPYKARFARDTPMRTITQALVGADVFVGLSVGGVIIGRDGRHDGRAADHLRARESGSGDHPRRGARRALRCDHRDGSLRLSEPGEQRPRLPVHLSRCARRARDADQRGDEDGRDARARLAREAGRPRQRRTAVRTLLGDVRKGVHHSVRIRSARAALGRPGRRVGRGRELASRLTSSISTTIACRSRRDSAERAESCAGS